MFIRVFEAFAGYGSQSIALSRIKEIHPDFDFEVVGISEIDKYPLIAYNALHPATTNYGDISKISWEDVPDFDLFTYSFPCTDIAICGRQKGFNENSNTRSSLLWECRKAILVKKPKYLFMENVKALVFKKNLPLFQKWINELESYGYKSFWKVINAKDYGIPQNRERVFMISVLDSNAKYTFPTRDYPTSQLWDIMEENVPDKYFLSEKWIKSINRHIDRKRSEGCGFKKSFVTKEDIATSITTQYGARETDTYVYATKNNANTNEITLAGRLVPPNKTSERDSELYRVYSPDGISPTLNTMRGGGGENA